MPRAGGDRAVRAEGSCLVVVVAVGAAALDQAGKRVLAVREPGAALGPVQVVLTHNPGVAFGMLASHPGPARILVLGITGLLLALGMRLSRNAGPVVRVLWGCRLGGALGNALDRVGPGGVVDWLRVAGYPAAFNLADILVRLSALALATWFLRSEASPARGRSSPRGDSGSGGG